MSVRKYLKYKQEWKRTFIIPFLCALVMGAAAFIVYHGIYMVLPVNVISLFGAIAVAGIVYFALLLKRGGVTKEELLNMPKGSTLVRVLEKIHLI